MVEKYEYGSPQWVKHAEKIIKDLVKGAGDSADGVKYSVCEVYYNGPSHISNEKGEVAWYFKIDGNQVTVGSEEIDSVDFKLMGDYKLLSQMSCLLYGVPEDVKKMNELVKEAKKSGNMSYTGDNRTSPKYLARMHNIMAKITK